MRSVCVFCGSRDGNDPAYREAAVAIGTEIAARGLTLVFGGGRVGLMGAVAGAALDAGGTVVGVIPEALYAKELAHVGVTDLRVVGTMHERKAAMADLADGFVALPGGFGTLEEFFEVVTWAQLGFHPKPCLLLDVHGYWDPLLALADEAVAAGFVEPGHRDLILRAQDPGEALDLMAAWRPVALPKWVTAEDR